VNKGPKQVEENKEKKDLPFSFTVFMIPFE
jgi:hypothetical protein